MSLLIDDQKLINLKFRYVEIPDKYASRFIFIRSKEDFERYKNDPRLGEANTGWKLLDWADFNHIYGECFKYNTNPDGTTTGNLDFIKFRDMKLKTCLKSWDIKDSNGKPVPISASSINKLHPDVAAELLNGFEKATETPPTEPTEPAEGASIAS